MTLTQLLLLLLLHNELLLLLIALLLLFPSIMPHLHVIFILMLLAQ